MLKIAWNRARRGKNWFFVISLNGHKRPLNSWKARSVDSPSISERCQRPTRSYSTVPWSQLLTLFINALGFIVWSVTLHTINANALTKRARTCHYGITECLPDRVWQRPDMLGLSTLRAFHEFSGRLCRFRLITKKTVFTAAWSISCNL